MRKSIKLTRAAAVLGAAALALTACGDDTAAEDPAAVEDVQDDAAEAEGDDADVEVEATASVSFANLSDGDTVASPLEVTFAFEGVTPVAAGDPVEGEGHFHVMVDVPCVEPGEVIVKDENHLHFGDGSTSATLELEPGEHTLCLQFADGLHTATDLTHEVTITVE